jgi:hypothetical protein
VAYGSAHLDPGETLCARGGRYLDHGEPTWRSSGTADRPVTLRAYPGETPIFNDASWSHGLIVANQSHVVISGLTFVGYGKAPSGDGAILLLDATGVTLEDCVIRDTGISELDHSIYVNAGTKDITIRGCTLHNSAGTHIHLNHEPGPRNVVIENNQIGNPDGSETAYGGVVVGCTATDATATVRNNVFRGMASNIQVCASADATVDAMQNDPDDTVNLALARKPRRQSRRVGSKRIGPLQARP